MRNLKIATVLLLLGNVSEVFAQNAPADSVFVTNLTTASIPIVSNFGEEYTLSDNKVHDLKCWDGLEIKINTDGKVTAWKLECKKRYMIRIDALRAGFEVVEVC